jgi:hypothetical protein
MGVGVSKPNSAIARVNSSRIGKDEKEVIKRTLIKNMRCHHGKAGAKVLHLDEKNQYKIPDTKFQIIDSESSLRDSLASR